MPDLTPAEQTARTIINTRVREGHITRGDAYRMRDGIRHELANLTRRDRQIGTRPEDVTSRLQGKLDAAPAGPARVYAEIRLAVWDFQRDEYTAYLRDHAQEIWARVTLEAMQTATHTRRDGSDPRGLLLQARGDDGVLVGTERYVGELDDLRDLMRQISMMARHGVGDLRTVLDAVDAQADRAQRMHAHRMDADGHSSDSWDDEDTCPCPWCTPGNA